MLYLTHNLKNNTNFFDTYYIDNLPLQKEIDFSLKIEEFYHKNLPKMFQNLKNEYDITKKRSILRKFPIFIQEHLLEISILSKELGIIRVNSIREFIIEEFEPFIEKFDDLVVSTLLYSSKVGELRCLNIEKIKESGDIEGMWEDCSTDNADRVSDKISKKKMEIHDNPYGYYGIINKDKDKFSIANILAEKEKIRITKTGKMDTRRVSTGRVCTTWDHEELLILIDKIKLPYSKEFEDRYKKKTDEQLKNEYDNKLFVKISKIMDKDKFDTLSRNDKLRLMYWGISGKDKINKPDICEAIEKWFKDNGLLDEILLNKEKPKNVKKKK
jgi:hypothetical protein